MKYAAIIALIHIPSARRKKRERESKFFLPEEEEDNCQQVTSRRRRRRRRRRHFVLDFSGMGEYLSPVFINYSPLSLSHTPFFLF